MAKHKTVWYGVDYALKDISGLVVADSDASGGQGLAEALFYKAPQALEL